MTASRQETAYEFEVSSPALRQEDIMMTGYTSLVGLALTFTLMFRLKFRFTSKWILLGCCVAIIIGNLIWMEAAFAEIENNRKTV